MTTSDAWRAALWTALFAFIALFGLSLLGWLGNVVEWAQDKEGVVLFPDPSVLFKGLVSAAVAAIIGLVNFVIRFAQAKTGIGQGPAYVRTRKS